MLLEICVAPFPSPRAFPQISFGNAMPSSLYYKCNKSPDTRRANRGERKVREQEGRVTSLDRYEFGDDSNQIRTVFSSPRMLGL